MRWVKFEARRGYAPVRWLGKQHMTQSHATQGMRECSQRRDFSRQKAAWSHCVRNAIHAAAELRTRILAGKRPHRLVVRTSRRGRDNPGSTPGVDISVVFWRSCAAAAAATNDPRPWLTPMAGNRRGRTPDGGTVASGGHDATLLTLRLRSRNNGYGIGRAQ